MPFCHRKKQVYHLQIPHKRKLIFGKFPRGRRASLCVSRKGSVTLETSLILPFLLCAVTALLYLFAFTSAEARAERKLMERAELLAVTAWQNTGDPYVRLYDADQAAFSFFGYTFGGNISARKAVVRAWVGYTGESFGSGTQEEIVFITPEGSVYHRNRDCSYLRLSIRQISYGEVDNARNQSGARYTPCEYCIRSNWSGSIVYVTDYGNSYHSTQSCQGLKRTVMAVPLSQTGGRRCCSRCGGA